MTRINPSQQNNYSTSTGSQASTASHSGSSSSQLLTKLVEALVTIVHQVEKQTGGGSLLSSAGSEPGIGATSSAGSSSSSQRRALDSAYSSAIGSSAGTGSGSGTAGSHAAAGHTSTAGSAATAATGRTAATSYTAAAGSAAATGSAASTGATGSASGVSAVAPSGPFSENTLHQYIVQALQQTPGGNNSLSGPQNIAKWDPSTAAGKKNLDSFYNGIVSAQKQFYPQVPVDQFAKLMVANSAQESTLDPDTGNGDGVIQANQSVRDDFAKYGQPLKDNQGNTIVSPGNANSKDPASCVMLWAWRTSSALAHGGNGPAQWGQNVAPTQSSNFGNALSVWLQGPASQPFFKNGSMDSSSFYVNRVQSYFQKIGGGPNDFQQLMSTKVGSSH